MELRELVTVLRTRWLTVVAFVVLGGILGGLLAGLSQSKYTARSTLFVSPNSTASSQNGTYSQQVQYVLQQVVSFVQLADSPLVLQPVIDDEKLNMSASTLGHEVSATNPSGTALIDITVVDKNAGRSATIATAVATSLEAEASKLATIGSATPIRLTLTHPGVKPGAASSPKRSVDIAAGLLLGLVVGIAVAIGRGAVRPRLRTESEVLALAGVAPLGAVARQRGNAIASSGQHGALDGSYQAIRDRLQLAGASSHLVTVTSALAGDGRTTLACNLAVALSRTDATVCLVEADLRSPGMAQYLSLDGSVGLVDVLTGRASIAEAVRPWQGTVQVILAGSPPADPSGLLKSVDLRGFFTDLASRYDFVVVDTPPAVPYADAVIVGQATEGVVLVTRYNSSTQDDVNLVLADLERAEVPLLGTVLIGVRGKAARAAG